MRSPIGPLLVLAGMAITVVLVLLLFGNLGMRSDLEAARGDLAELRTQVESIEPGLTEDELTIRLDELETAIAGLLVSSGGGTGAPSPGADDGDDGTDSAIADRLDDIIARIDALDDRIDEICGNVPVC